MAKRREEQQHHDDGIRLCTHQITQTLSQTKELHVEASGLTVMVDRYSQTP